jgi:hypothetical protein
VRILAGAIFGLRDGGLFQCSQHATMQEMFFDLRFVRQDGFFDLRTDAQDRIKRSHRLLKNHGDFAAAHGAPRGFVEFAKILLRIVGGMEKHFASDACTRGQQAHQSHGQHGFATAGFADDAQRLARLDTQ